MPASVGPDHRLHLVPTSTGQQAGSDCNISPAQAGAGSVSGPGHLLTPLSGMPYSSTGYLWPPASNAGPTGYAGFPSTPSYHQQQPFPGHAHRPNASQMCSPISDGGHDQTGSFGPYDLGGPSPTGVGMGGPSPTGVGMGAPPPLPPFGRPRTNITVNPGQQPAHVPFGGHSSPPDVHLPRHNYYHHSPHGHHSIQSSPFSASPPNLHLYTNRQFSYPTGGQVPSGGPSLTPLTSSPAMMVSPYGAMQMSHPIQPIFTAQPIATPLQDRPFKCNECPQSFNRNHDLKRHKRIHLDVKPFPCGHCDKSFSRKDALKRHILVKGCGKSGSPIRPTPTDSTIGSVSVDGPSSAPSTPASIAAPGSAGRVRTLRERMSGSSTVSIATTNSSNALGSTGTTTPTGSTAPPSLNNSAIKSGNPDELAVSMSTIGGSIGNSSVLGHPSGRMAMSTYGLAGSMVMPMSNGSFNHHDEIDPQVLATTAQ